MRAMMSHTIPYNFLLEKLKYASMMTLVCWPFASVMQPLKVKQLLLGAFIKLNPRQIRLIMSKVLVCLYVQVIRYHHCLQCWLS